MKKRKKSSIKEVSVYLEFDKNLRELTGTEREKIHLSDGTPVLMFIQAVLETYPRILTKYSLSSIAFSVNGNAPQASTTLSANDLITIHVTDLDQDYFDIQFTDYRH